MNEQELFYTLALTRMTGFNPQVALQLYRELGGGKSVYDHRNDVTDVIGDCTPRLAEALRNWDNALARSEAELAFIRQHSIKPLMLNDDDYPARLRECPDAPIALFYLGNADLNRQHVVNIVGTRHGTSYGQDLIRRLLADMRDILPGTLVVSGLAYGIDICAHRNALEQGFDTVAVLAHGLDTVYPSRHRDTAIEMVKQGGLLTEYMSQTEPMANNFRMRNRIVAGMSDATIVVESAYKGGALITARIAQEYGRDVFAYPGAVGAPYSEGCNNLIRDSKAALVTSADDIINIMGWQPAAGRQRSEQGIERQLFPNLDDNEQKVVSVLHETNDLQLNIISVRTNIPIGQLTALLFQLEMKGVVRPMAGGTYHLLT